MNKIETKAVELLTVMEMIAPAWDKDLTIHEMDQVLRTVSGIIEARRHLDYAKSARAKEARAEMEQEFRVTGEYR